MTPSKKRHVYQQKHQPQPKQQKAIPMRKSRNKLWIALALLAILFISIGGYYMIVQGQNQSQNQVPNASPTPTPSTSPSPSPTASSSVQGTKVLLHTNMGDIPLQLRDDKPITTANFINLVKQGKYDGTVFHRIMVGFMIQGGGVSGSVSTISDEIGSNNRNVPYTIAMANTGQPNSATSQFFINVADNGNNAIDEKGTKFDQAYTVFGTVISGQNVVDAISNVPVTPNPYMPSENSVPVNTITLIKATIVS